MKLIIEMTTGPAGGYILAVLALAAMLVWAMRTDDSDTKPRRK